MRYGGTNRSRSQRCREPSRLLPPKPGACEDPALFDPWVDGYCMKHYMVSMTLGQRNAIMILASISVN